MKKEDTQKNAPKKFKMEKRSGGKVIEKSKNSERFNKESERRQKNDTNICPKTDIFCSKDRKLDGIN